MTNTPFQLIIKKNNVLRKFINEVDETKRGHGKALVKRIVKIVVERGCGRLELSCLDWNKPSIDFYLSLGAKKMEDWTVYRFAGESLTNLAK